MNIYIENHPRQDRWWVHLDVWMVSFSTLDDATAFVDRLNARINAPHSLAMLANHPFRSDALMYNALTAAPGNVGEVRNA